MAVQREKYTNVHSRRGTGWEANTFPIPCVEFCTAWHPSGTGDTPKPSHSDPRRCLFPPHLPQPMSVPLGQAQTWQLLPFHHESTRTQPLPRPRRRERAGTRDGLRSPFHARWQTPWQMGHTSAKDEGLYDRQREKKMLFSTSIQKRAARRFYSSRQHPIASQQFALTTKLSKKKQRRGHLSDGLRRSQLFAQETAKKPPKPAYHISPSYWSMTKRRIYGKRGQRGEKQKSIGSNRAWRKITSLIKRGYLPG